ncbi:unnamed protein product, partial [Meganyctiphanes norvegica]
MAVFNPFSPRFSCIIVPHGGRLGMFSPRPRDSSTLVMTWSCWSSVPCRSLATTTDKVLSRLVTTKYGQIQGFIQHHGDVTGLPPVEVFLGVPYAQPPLGHARFSPTMSPLPWEGVRKCVTTPLSCPQPLVGSPGAGEEPPPPERAKLLARLRPLLQRQSEDCLYLNIYAPHDGGGDRAVMVYIHGESFSWGSGSLYDGSVLSSYGQVVVVTINYRLGPLGFLNTSPGAAEGGMGVVGNQGLLDQLAALSWVNQNIRDFGGDPNRITLFGHSTGAACINYLLVSPVVVPGMFHRAILMSGSALSQWAEVRDALSVTARLAQRLNCSLPSDLTNRHPETMACLRNVSAQQLVNVGLPRYKFNAMFGPSVDGVVVPNDLKTRLTRVRDEQQISVLFGVTQSDGFIDLNNRQASTGIDASERKRMFKTFVRNNYQEHLQEIYLAISKEYTDWGNPSQDPMKIRDLTVEALSDGEFLSPLTKFGETFSGADSRAYMYIFSHQDTEREGVGSIFGSEVPLVFGSPFMSNPGPWQKNFTRADAMVSEALMTYWTNFAKTGDPNMPEEQRPRLSYKDRTQPKNNTWEPYDTRQEQYMEISYRSRGGSHYRPSRRALWNWLIPHLQGKSDPSQNTAHDQDAWYLSESDQHFIGPVRPIDPFRFLKPTRQPPSLRPDIPTPKNEYLAPNVSAAQGNINKPLEDSSDANTDVSGHLLDYTTALTLTVTIGLSLLVLNAILFAALLYRKDRPLNSGTKLKYDSVSAQPLCIVDSGMQPTTSSNEGLASPDKPQNSTNIDLQYTELRTYPSPPDIGDRPGATFHGSTSMHSILSQPISQFIPPPPLQAGVPSSSTVGTIHIEGGQQMTNTGGHPNLSLGQIVQDGTFHTLIQFKASIQHHHQIHAQYYPILELSTCRHLEDLYNIPIILPIAIQSNPSYLLNHRCF